MGGQGAEVRQEYDEVSQNIVGCVCVCVCVWITLLLCPLYARARACVCVCALESGTQQHRCSAMDNLRYVGAVQGCMPVSKRRNLPNPPTMPARTVAH